MDGREGLGMSGSASYFIHRGMGPQGSGSPSGLHPPLGMSRTLPNSNPSFSVQTSAVAGSGVLGSGGSVGSAFQSASPAVISPHGVNTGSGSGVSADAGQGGQLKRKRGRPRKYGPDGSVSLALSPISTSPSVSGTASAGPSGSGSGMPTQKRGRGRPPGSGRKQQLASLGEWAAGSAGIGFTPHVITIPVGEDIASKIMSFSQQGPRAVCILSANGSVSTATLRQPATSGGSVTYEGRFEILCLSGSYLMNNDEGGSRGRSGGLSISLSSPDGRVIGGGVGGLLIAASPVQVIVGSFIYGGSKSKSKAKVNEESMEPPQVEGEEQQSPPSSILPSHSHHHHGPWAASGRQPDIRNAHVDIDLMRG
ncbi:hypothetical protein HPP92_004700 [Vanilla planifolia]|uniref:AT-hook motif nuclear-localized protein n=1 Tax=Vanilla planifolia TaxID=51239 RepID=A0A835VAM2_VANPL|nr:hypothetical protein HPP92_005045 [Vanilla planifolia]KAG0493706.1 hypothetical protein HPP92_004700 [Vanilla planifolia]